ncbi:MAG: GNAT family N-acetyltransferase [Alistipes sp.]|jgi:ribosomal protein S18 acetylase RimI-like enzyme|nr:GNAT family N-acetyltransferase [Alistipes sp.]
MEIRSLSADVGFGVPTFDDIARAFAAAFAEYEVQISPAELRTMLRRRGFAPSLSFAAFTPQGEIAAFTLNGVGGFGGPAAGGVKTAYDTGTGTLPEFRGRGLATRIFEESLPALRAAGIGQYILEVLRHNTTAVEIYRRMGFGVRREFNYFRGGGGNGRSDLSYAEYELRRIKITDIQSIAKGFWDFEPSWQNSFEAIERAASDFIFLGAFDGGRLAGYAVFEPAAGDITQIAVAHDSRRRGVGSALLGEMLRLNRAAGLKCLNTEEGRDEALAGFLEARGVGLAGRQFEMVLQL